MGGEEYLIVFPEDHVDLQVITRLGESPVVVNLHSDEGRDGIPFRKVSISRRAASSLPMKKLSVAFPPRIVRDLRHEACGRVFSTSHA